MNPCKRLTLCRSSAPVQQFTPDQRAFIDANAVGRFAHDLNYHPGYATRITRHADNTCDVVGLDADAQGWIDLGGPTPRDVQVGRL